jgi:ribosomal protein L12E/L44/L45/RPP1/RPP2
MFENFKRMATPRNIQILFAIIGVFILIAVLKTYNLYEGLENQATTTAAAAPTAAAPTAAAAPSTAAATNASAPPSNAVAPPVQITKTTGPSTNNPIIS